MDQDRKTAWKKKATDVRESIARATRERAGQVAAVVENRQKSVVHVTMLGSIGVGKTTLIASMYECFGKVVDSTVPLDMRPTGATSRELSVLVAKLRAMTNELRVAGGLVGNATVEHYDFGICKKEAKDAAFTVRFTDYPGTYLLPKEFADRELVEEALADSDVIMVAVDAPALMENHGALHGKINQPLAVMDEIRRLVSTSSQPRLLILTLLKCETYLATPETTAELVGRVRKEYQPLLDYISDSGVRNRVGCVLTAVQTIGPIRLISVEIDKADVVRYHFATNSIDAAYAPVDTDQPLRYLLRFVINKYRADDRGWLGDVWQTLNGVDRALEDAVDAFAAGCKADGGFAVLQDHVLLHTPPRRLPRPGGRGRRRA